TRTAGLIDFGEAWRTRQSGHIRQPHRDAEKVHVAGAVIRIGAANEFWIIEGAHDCDGLPGAVADDRSKLNCVDAICMATLRRRESTGRAWSRKTMRHNAAWTFAGEVPKRRCKHGCRDGTIFKT